ncbi:MAG: hypothetical protein NTY99_01985 [DPANN group archaeon]|nr:hypothetical protein [DPANN group archaeon]
MDKKIFALIVVVCAAILASFLAYLYYSPLAVVEYDMHVYVGDKIGFNLDTDKLWFGIIPPGAGGSRNVSISNDYYAPVKVKMTASGDLAKWAGIANGTTNPFILQPNETKSIQIVVNIPANLNKSNTTAYTGELRAYSYRIFSFP